MRNILLLLLLFFTVSLAAQEELSFPKLELPNTKRIDRDPVKLIFKLTEGKKSDKEKFDAIFTWVAQNIHYDYGTYYSPRGASAPKLKRILKYKTGICLDYAYLMDTLCTLAGIRNVSVYGYAKDELFDIGDSLYVDNHAWNAVKLENYWYVYDVTWSAGQYIPKFTRFSQFIINWEKRLWKRKKVRTITFRPKFKLECNPKTGKFKQSYTTIPRWSIMLLKILSHVKLRVHYVMDKNINQDYYLTNPELFAITHIPDNPYWSLSGEYPTIRYFETDSAFYHLDDSTFVNQDRQSRHCGECDSYFALDPKTKQKEMKHNSWEFNPRNHFVPWLANYNLGNIFYTESIPINDSTTKIQCIDSALSYYDMARNDLKQSYRDVVKENQLLRAKNATKLKNLLAENRIHISYIHALLAETNKSTSKMKKFIGRTRVTEVGLRADKNKLHKLNVKTIPYKNKDNVLVMQNKYIQLSEKIDSLNQSISILRGQYDGMLIILSNNLWQKDKIQDSLAGPFYRGMYNRLYYQMDGRKKTIVEDRKSIEPIKQLYASDLESTIYRLSDSCGDLGMQIFRFMGKRDALLLEAGRLLNVLVNEKMVGKDSLKDYIRSYNDIIQENICWITSGSSKLKSVVVGYKVMLLHQKELKLLIQKENRAEATRYRIVNKEITRRKIKYSSIPANNLRVCSFTKRMVTYYKRDYLKSLKDKRKKEKEKNKKKKKTI
ncbi:MAG: transglutaminase domain-containing protein [Bacteroidetes bacterium]|nr:transglutaminase domain-containing protein [Bacteroidota bacterium]